MAELRAIRAVLERNEIASEEDPAVRAALQKNADYERLAHRVVEPAPGAQRKRDARRGK